MKLFYQRFIKIDGLLEELDSLELSPDEKVHLTTLIDDSLYNLVLDQILSNLQTEDKKLFLKLIAEDKSHEKLVDFLQGKVDNIEAQLQKATEQLIKELHKDVKEVKRLKGAKKKKDA